MEVASLVGGISRRAAVVLVRLLRGLAIVLALDSCRRALHLLLV